MSHSDTGKHTAGLWLMLASFLLAVVFIFHGPPAPNAGDQMQIIAGGSMRWAIIHWVAAAALSAFAVAGLLVLTSGSRLTQDWWTMSAWAVLSVGALWTVSTAVAEASVVAEAAASGDAAVFAAWWAFSEGKANGFAGLALAVTVIGGNEARIPQGATPSWAAWIATIAGLASFGGWALGSWLGLGVGGPIWVVSSLVMCLWLWWFGLALTRSEAGLVTRQRDVASEA